MMYASDICRGGWGARMAHRTGARLTDARESVAITAKGEMKII